jgi:hypothetical protein
MHAKHCLLFLIFLPSLAFGQSNPPGFESEILFAEIFALDSTNFNLEKMERYWEGDTSNIYSPGFPVILPLDPDTAQFITMVHWGPEWSRGALTDFYLFDRKGLSPSILAATTETSVMVYGGGSQEFGDVLVSDHIWRLSDSILALEVHLDSYHPASLSEGETMSLFAIIGNRIENVFEVFSYGFTSLELDTMEANDHEFIEMVLENIEEYVPRHYNRDCICEYQRTLTLSSTTTNGMYDLLIQVTKYQLTREQISKTIAEEVYRWQGSKYELASPK